MSKRFVASQFKLTDSKNIDVYEFRNNNNNLFNLFPSIVSYMLIFLKENNINRYTGAGSVPGITVGATRTRQSELCFD